MVWSGLWAPAVLVFVCWKSSCTASLNSTQDAGTESSQVGLHGPQVKCPSPNTTLEQTWLSHLNKSHLSWKCSKSSGGHEVDHHDNLTLLFPFLLSTWFGALSQYDYWWNSTCFFSMLSHMYVQQLLDAYSLNREKLQTKSCVANNLFVTWTSWIASFKNIP